VVVDEFEESPLTDEVVAAADGGLPMSRVDSDKRWVMRRAG